MDKLNKIAVIPDVHGKDFWKEAKEKVDSLDKIIFLGDYLDAYPDNIYASFFYISLEKEQAARKEELNNFKEILEFKKAFPVYKEFLRWAFGIVGQARGGDWDCGSIVWADSSEWENEKNIFKEIKQSVRIVLN